jgi:hypothetical protein
MVTVIFLGICLAGEAYLLYCLFHFVEEAIRTWCSNRTKTARFVKNQEMSQLQVISPLSIALWEEGGWRLRIADHCQVSAKRIVSPQAKR